MKKHLLWIAPAILAIAMLFSSFGGGDTKSGYPSGSPGGYTGSPGDGQNCATSGCHGTSVANVAGWITSDVPPEGYTPGNAYTITATSTGSGRKGFEISPQDLSGNLLGTLSPGSGNKLCHSNKAVTHSSGVTTNPAVWTFTWTAPAAGTGSVTFYGAFAITQSQTKLTTMVVNENVATPLSATATATPSAICAGGTSQLNAIAAGGNPPYTYSWTSNPPGFTSTIQNPLVSPTETTTYTVQVGDGTNSATASVAVVVTQAPTASAGSDTTVCFWATQFFISGTASKYTTVAWTTSGDGTFNPSNALATFYSPGTVDHTTGSVDLTLTVQPVSPCINAASSVKHIIFDPCTGVHAIQGEGTGFVVSPNPSAGLINIIPSQKIENNYVVAVFNSLGQQIFTKTGTGRGISSIPVDLTGLGNGVYFLKLQTGKGMSIRKVVLK